MTSPNPQIPATINGEPKIGTLVELLAQVPTGDTLAIPAGVWAGAGNVPNAITVVGAGMNATTIDGGGMELASGKAIFCPMATGGVFEDMTITGAACPDDNGAGIRAEGTGISFAATRVRFLRNQDGVLSWGSNKFTGCIFKDNGCGNGLSHNAYIVQDAPGQVNTFDACISECGPETTHALKSRSWKTVVNNGTYESAGNPDANIAGSVIDIPDGGTFIATKATIVLKSGSANNTFVGYGEESALNVAGGVTCSLHACTFVGQGTIANGGNIPNATLDVTGSMMTAGSSVAIAGFTHVIGTIGTLA